MWELVAGFQGYAFCRAHSTAYGVEAYAQAGSSGIIPPSSWRACSATAKGFYSKLVYSIECRRLGLGFRSPDVNRSRNHFFPEGNALRVPLFQIKGLSQRLLEHWERGKPYESMRDFYIRTTPSTDEMDHLIRTGAFDAFGQSRTEQFWQFKELAQWPAIAGQGLLLAGDEKPTLPDIPLEEPSLIERLKAEQDILGFPVADHPLALFPGVLWDSYCPIIQPEGPSR